MRVPGNDIIIGNVVGTRTPLVLPKTARDKHLYICGSTGTGKSKLLESLIRQDILNWPKSKSGLLLLDPHGSLYDSLMSWLAWYAPDRPVVPIDLRRDDWVVSYNLLRPRKTANTSVIVSNFVQAMAHVWGQSGTQATPLFARWASNVFHALYENAHTLQEARYWVDRFTTRERRTFTSRLKNAATRQDWEFANSLSPEKFDVQINSTVNRLRSFIGSEVLEPMFGQSECSLDLRKALDDGSIILVNLATEGGKISGEDASLFATLLLSDLWTAARERGKPKDGRAAKPFYLYIDEFQNFITPDIAKNLDQARGFGLALTLSNQFPRQILHEGANGARVYDSVMANARSKIVFSLEGEENLRPLAQSLFMGVMNPDQVKHELYSTKVMAYAEEYREVYSKGRTSARGGSSGTSRGTTENLSGSLTEDLEQNDPTNWSSALSEGESENESWSESESSSTSTVPVLIPKLGKELSHVQFRSLDEQLFRSMAVLFDQKQRQGVARLAEMTAPVSIFTPTVKPPRSSDKRVEKYRIGLLKKLDFALPAAEARKRIASREAKILTETVPSLVDEPATTKRRLKP